MNNERKGPCGVIHVGRKDIPHGEWVLKEKLNNTQVATASDQGEDHDLNPKIGSWYNTCYCCGRHILGPGVGGQMFNIAKPAGIGKVVVCDTCFDDHGQEIIEYFRAGIENSMPPEGTVVQAPPRGNI